MRYVLQDIIGVQLGILVLKHPHWDLWSVWILVSLKVAHQGSTSGHSLPQTLMTELIKACARSQELV